jgi:hypothetical protein
MCTALRALTFLSAAINAAVITGCIYLWRNSATKRKLRRLAAILNDDAHSEIAKEELGYLRRMLPVDTNFIGKPTLKLQHVLDKLDTVTKELEAKMTDTSPESEASLSGLDEHAVNLGITGIPGTLTEKIKGLAREAECLSNRWFVLELF